MWAAGVGYKLDAELTAMGVSTVNDLRAFSKASLVSSFGERVGSYLHCACRGEDPTPVQQSGPPRSITVEVGDPSIITILVSIEYISQGCLQGVDLSLIKTVEYLDDN